MLAESFDKNEQIHIPPVPSTGARQRSLKGSTSLDPQPTLSAKSKKMFAKWYWSFPPPEKDKDASKPHNTSS